MLLLMYLYLAAILTLRTSLSFMRGILVQK